MAVYRFTLTCPECGGAVAHEASSRPGVVTVRLIPRDDNALAAAIEAVGRG